MMPTDLESLSRRLARVEANERRWRRACVGLLAVVIVGAVAGARHAPEELTVRRLTVEDANGKGRVILEAGEDVSGLTVYSADGQSRIQATTDDEDHSQVAVYAKDTPTSAVGMAVGAKDVPGMHVRVGETSTILMSASKANGPAIRLTGPSGKKLYVTPK